LILGSVTFHFSSFVASIFDSVTTDEDDDDDDDFEKEVASCRNNV